MRESAPLQDRLSADLTDNQWVTITAVGLAAVAFVLVSLESSPLPVSADFGAEFLLSLSLMDLAFAYGDYWPVEYRPRDAVAWTLLFGAVTAVVFLSVYEFGLSHVGHTIASSAAFLIAVGLQFGSAVLYARVR
jgi:vacuolar-type H+-ATPase subunit I/STV1